MLAEVEQALPSKLTLKRMPVRRPMPMQKPMRMRMTRRVQMTRQRSQHCVARGRQYTERLSGWKVNRCMKMSE